ncbi:EcsC family protein [uncultured Abyssibacter sp.]|uniref:EcsC family protein n=1 Tax=uncultured Abyssibacter sp. TaxID=2320202 RepID=UPI0032B107C4
MNDDAISDETRLAAVRNWERQPPGIGVRGLGQSSGRIARYFRGAVPTSLIEMALNSANDLALRSSSTATVLRWANADSVESLRAAPLDLGDRLSQRVQREAMAAAATLGATTGLGGAALMAVDIPALITLCLRTIHRTGLAYGLPLEGEAGRMLAIGLFALSSSNTPEDKQAAIEALSRTTPGTPMASLLEAAWREGLERASERELTKRAVTFSMSNLGRQLGWNLAKRKSAAAIPVLGAVVGGSVNAWTVYDLARNTRFAFLAWRLGHWGPQSAIACTHMDALPAPPTDERSGP